MSECPEAEQIGRPYRVRTPLGLSVVRVYERRPNSYIKVDPRQSCILKQLTMERYYLMTAIEGLSPAFKANNTACLHCGCYIDAVIRLVEV